MNEYDLQAFPAHILDSINHPLLVLDLEGYIRSANRAYTLLLGESEASIVAKSFYGVHRQQWNIPELRMLLNDLTSEKQHYSIAKISSQFAASELKTMVFYARKIKRRENVTILLSIEDATAYNDAA